MKLVSYNLNGIRSAMSKGFGEWMMSEQADIICLQELKAWPDDIDLAFFENAGYHFYAHYALKKGYSGVAILSKSKPIHVCFGCDIAQYDAEGRVIRADFDDFSVLNVYMPSGSMGQARQDFKNSWLSDFSNYISELKNICPNLIISGDFNIVHRAIDIHNPKANANSSGFLPEERAWMSSFLESGFVDTFRYFEPETLHKYSWWSFRAGSRSRNLGWRIDYNMASVSMIERLKGAYMLDEVSFSDHCPVVLIVENRDF